MASDFTLTTILIVVLGSVWCEQRPFLRYSNYLKKALPYHWQYDQEKLGKSVDKITRWHQVEELRNDQYHGELRPHLSPLRPRPDSFQQWKKWAKQGILAAVVGNKDKELLKVRAQLLQEKLSPNHHVFKKTEVHPQEKPKFKAKEKRFKRHIRAAVINKLEDFEKEPLSGSILRPKRQVVINPQLQPETVMQPHIQIAIPPEPNDKQKNAFPDKRGKRQILYIINRPSQLLYRSPRTTPNPFIRETNIGDYDIGRQDLEGSLPDLGSSRLDSYPLIKIHQALYRLLKNAEMKIEQSMKTEQSFEIETIPHSKLSNITEESLIRVKRRMSRFRRDRKQMTRKKKIGRRKKTKVRRAPVKLKKWYDKRQKKPKKGDGTYRGGKGRKPRQHKRPRHYKPPQNETSDYDYYDSDGKLRAPSREVKIGPDSKIQDGSDYESQEGDDEDYEEDEEENEDNQDDEEYEEEEESGEDGEEYEEDEESDEDDEEYEEDEDSDKNDEDRSTSEYEEVNEDSNNNKFSNDNDNYSYSRNKEIKKEKQIKLKTQQKSHNPIVYESSKINHQTLKRTPSIKMAEIKRRRDGQENILDGNREKIYNSKEIHQQLDSQHSSNIRQLAKKFSILSISSNPEVRNSINILRKTQPNPISFMGFNKCKPADQMTSLNFGTPDNDVFKNLQSMLLKKVPDANSITNPGVVSSGGNKRQILQSKTFLDPIQSISHDKAMKMTSVAREKSDNPLIFTSKSKHERKKLTSIGNEQILKIQSLKSDPLVLTSVAKHIPVLELEKKITEGVNTTLKTGSSDGLNVFRKKITKTRNIKNNNHLGLVSITKHTPILELDSDKSNIISKAQKTKRSINIDIKQKTSSKLMGKLQNNFFFCLKGQKMQKLSSENKLRNSKKMQGYTNNSLEEKSNSRNSESFEELSSVPDDAGVSIPSDEIESASNSKRK